MKIPIVQTSRFTKDVQALLKKKSLTPDDFEEFKDYLSENPKAGDVVQGAGGIRKIRLKSAGKGKSGGFRVCYFYYQESEGLYLIWVYPKNEQENLTTAEKKILKGIVNAIKEK
jgi:mRNA-degrading endonuclease RelE of RelBE toxin-antitoxin system